MMMSGSCRISARRPSAKPMSIAGCTWVWLKAGSIISIGSSIVQTLTSSVARRLSVRVQRRRLAAAGGPGDEDDAVRPRDQFLPALRVVGAEAERLEVLDRGVGVEDAHHHLLAEGGGQGRQAHLDLAAGLAGRLGRRVLMRPSSGRRRSTTSMRPSSLMRAVIAFITAQRHLVDGVQHAVDAKADHAHLAPRLEVDVAGALVEGVLPQPVDHLHHALVVGVELLVASCPARPAARSWPRGEISPLLLRRAHRLAPARRTRSCSGARRAGWPAPACTLRRVWASISATQSMSKGSAVAIVTSVGADRAPAARGASRRSCTDITSATRPTSTFSGSMRR